MNKKIVIGAAIAGSIVFILFFMSIAYFGTLSPDRFLPTRSFAETSADISKGSTQSYPSTNIASGMPATAQPEQSQIDTMYFQNYGTNTFIDTSKDRLSTFALDVDTASYTVAKNYIMRGELPPTDAIRPEEFINYFDYQYPNPEEDFGIYTELSPSPFEENIHYLKIGIKSHEVENRKDAVLTFVVDVSGSMNRETRIGLVKKTMRFLVEQLREGDEVAIIKYQTTAEVVLEHTSIQDKQRILDAIDSLSPGGSTNAEAGLVLGYKQASLNLRQDATNRIVLLSDGVANVGNTGADSILNQLKSYKDQGISITAIGVGMGNYNDVLLEQIADKGDGNYYYINDFNEAKRVFQAQLTGTLETIAKDAKIQVDFNPDTVQKYRLIGYENRALDDESFRDDTKDAGELGAGHEVTAIYELELKSQTGSFGRIYLRYKDPDNDESEEISKDILSSDLKYSFDSSSSRFRLGVAVARFAQILKLTAPPPEIQKVSEIINSITLIDDTETDFKTVLSNAKRLIEIKQGE